MNHERRQNDPEIISLRRDIEEVRLNVESLREELKEMMDSFNAASNLLRWIKWLAVFIAGCAGSYTAWKGIK